MKTPSLEEAERNYPRKLADASPVLLGMSSVEERLRCALALARKLGMDEISMSDLLELSDKIEENVRAALLRTQIEDAIGPRDNDTTHTAVERLGQSLMLAKTCPAEMGVLAAGDAFLSWGEPCGESRCEVHNPSDRSSAGLRAHVVLLLSIAGSEVARETLDALKHLLTQEDTTFAYHSTGILLRGGVGYN